MQSLAVQPNIFDIHETNTSQDKTDLSSINGFSSSASSERSVLEKLHKITQNLVKEPLVKNLHIPFLEAATWTNALSAGVNSIAGLIKAPKFISNVFSKAGQLSSSLSFFTLGLGASLTNFGNRNYIMALGQAVDMLVAFLPQSISFLAHGFASGIYCLGAALNTAANKSKFTNLDDYLSSMQKGFKKIIKGFSSERNKNLLDEKTGCLGFLGSSLALFGASFWKLTGSKILGSTIRNIGELMLVFNQINPQNKTLKPNYYKSGKKAAIGTLIDYVAKLLEPRLKAVLYPLSLVLFFSGQRNYIDYQRSPEIVNG